MLLGLLPLKHCMGTLPRLYYPSIVRVLSPDFTILCTWNLSQFGCPSRQKSYIKDIAREGLGLPPPSALPPEVHCHAEESEALSTIFGPLLALAENWNCGLQIETTS